MVFSDARLYCGRLWHNHSWLLVHILFLNITSFVKTSNKHQCCQLKFSQCIVFIALHPLFCWHLQIINTHGHERPDYSEAMKHLGGPSTIFPNSTVCCSDTPKLYTVTSIYPFKEKSMLFGLPRLECSLARVILSKILYDRMKIKVKANGA